MIIDGKKIARKILKNLAEEIKKIPFKPLFCDILIGQDPVSQSYIRIKGRTAKSVGLDFHTVLLPEDTKPEAVLEKIRELNLQPNIRGLIIQLPVPEDFNQQKLLDAIEPKFDVDCMGSVNLKAFYQGHPCFLPPTAAAILKILDTLPVDISAKEILVIGQGDLVGKPVSFLLKQRGLLVNVADRSTPDILELMRRVDIIISATGQPKLITGDKIKYGSIIVDAGTAETNAGIVGDVDFDSVSKVAGMVSPVPGGVGPVTVAMLLSNVVKAAKK